jgi:hypothetical protein
MVGRPELYAGINVRTGLSIKGVPNTEKLGSFFNSSFDKVPHDHDLHTLVSEVISASTHIHYLNPHQPTLSLLFGV